MVNESYLLHQKRLIGYYLGKQDQPTLVVFAGIHGNEDAGVKAVQKILKRIENEKIAFDGNIFFIYGNTKALRKNKRYIDVDLNRIWCKENIRKIKSGKGHFTSEEKEQKEIYRLVKDILNSRKGPFYFIDLHTTSSSTNPFITISDSLNNRNFSSKFPLPTVLGIEEYLDGPILTYMNEFGYIALGFEAGQHKDSQSVRNSEAFIWLSLVYTKCIKKTALSDFKVHKNELLKSKCKNKYKFFEIKYLYKIKKDETFRMIPGFKNFDKIKKTQVLAESNGKEIRSPMTGRIFMPLYQNQGDDGFFIISMISRFWLSASIVARKLHAHNFLRILPGVHKENEYTLIVDPRTAKFLTKQIFHLFGYRQQVLKGNKLHFIKRDRRILPFT